MSAISKALVQAQKNFGKALKTSTNPHFKSQYASLSNVVEAVIDGLHSANIALIQKTHEVQGGVQVETIFLHESGEEYSAGVLFVPAVKQDAQGYGSALTYARRYSLMTACGIAPEDDDGNAASQPRKPAAPAMTIDQAKDVIELATTMPELVAAWNQIPAQHRKALMQIKDAKKEALANAQ